MSECTSVRVEVSANAIGFDPATGRQRVMLVSVEEKTGIEDPVGRFYHAGGKIIASKGTCEYLSRFGIEALEVSVFTGEEVWPGHEVVTIHPLIEGGLLVPDIPERHEFLAKRGGLFIDVLLNTLYDSREALADPQATPASVRKRTDVGGICLRHAGAKGGRWIATSASVLSKILDALEHGTATDAMREQLCADSEMECVIYLFNFTRFLSGGRYAALFGERAMELAYGENPHQAPASYYREIGDDDPLGMHHFTQLEGNPPGYVNMTDYDKVIYLLRKIAATFQVNRGRIPYIVVALKHGNACGVGIDYDDREIAIKKAIDSDRLSIKGAIVGADFAINDSNAELFIHYGEEEGKRRVLDGIIALDFTVNAVEILKREKTHQCRVFANPALGGLALVAGREIRPLAGGFLQQPIDTMVLDLSDERMTKSVICSREVEDDMLLAAAICGASDSNTTTFCRGGQLLANATGEKSRVFSIEKAGIIATANGHTLEGSAGCTDSFCPEVDGPEAFVRLKPALIFLPSGGMKNTKVFTCLEVAGLPVYSMHYKDCRMFHGH